ncbi:MAG: hypothetical protein EAZ55_05955 [Cytophagales bacterium]|nr:MAG: hypothetical protein EAZ55_05955 [Cytophagales bacterium]
MKKIYTYSFIALSLLINLSQKTYAQTDNDADKKETIEWIEGKVKEFGNFKYYFRGENEFFDAKFYVGSSKCTWFYEVSERFYDDPEKGKGSKPRTYKIKFDLKDITEINLVTIEGNMQTKKKELYYAIEFRTYNDKNKIKENKKQYSKEKDNATAIYLSDKEIAERFVKACYHALELCTKGKVKEEKF